MCAAAQVHTGGAQHLACRTQPGDEARRRLEHVVEGLRLQPLQRALGHVLGVQRKGGCVLGIAQLIGQSSLLFQEPAGFGQQQLAQFHGRGCGKHRTFKAQFHQPWQEAAVGQVRLGQHHRVDRSAGHGERRAVVQAQLLQALEQPAVQQQPAALMLDDHLRSGDRARTPQKAQLHSMYLPRRVSNAAPLPAFFKLALGRVLIERNELGR